MNEISDINPNSVGHVRGMIDFPRMREEDQLQDWFLCLTSNPLFAE